MLAFLFLTTALCTASPQTTASERPPAWNPKFYAYDMEASDSKRRSLADEARMLRQLGFDGAGYVLWLDDTKTPLRMFGVNLEANLRTLDEAGLPLLTAGVVVNVDPVRPAYDPRLPEAIRLLKGRSLTIDVMLDGLPPGDANGKKPAMDRLRHLGDLAAESDLRISIYHHIGSWARSFTDALQLVKELDHPRVGVNLNLAHWLMLEGNKDYRPHLRAAADKLFGVTINGAKLGGKTIPELIQPLDQGDFDNRALLALLREIGFRGSIGLQCYNIPGDARDHLQRSMNVWKSWRTDGSKHWLRLPDPVSLGVEADAGTASASPGAMTMRWRPGCWEAGRRRSHSDRTG